MHYQLPPHAQGKLVRVPSGRVFDVVVDLRRSSSTFGKWSGVELSDETHEMLWVPEGFAHGFLVLSDSAVVTYRTSAVYSPDSERALRWDDPEVAIRWPKVDDGPLLSAKDGTAVRLDAADVFP